MSLLRIQLIFAVNVLSIRLLIIPLFQQIAMLPVSIYGQNLLPSARKSSFAVNAGLQHMYHENPVVFPVLHLAVISGVFSEKTDGNTINAANAGFR